MQGLVHLMEMISIIFIVFTIIGLQPSALAGPLGARVNALARKTVSDVVAANGVSYGVDPKDLPVVKATWHIPTFPGSNQVALGETLKEAMEQAKTTNPDFEADFSLNGTSIAQPVRLLGARNQETPQCNIGGGIAPSVELGFMTTRLSQFGGALKLTVSPDTDNYAVIVQATDATCSAYCSA
ncbi:MAG: hypothetical protein LQ340_003209 [Diploschistes diacapsis]|nr:MAG: hypothetical protein LQ340_003209 [Diploschistes diacapsis]